MRRKRSNSTLCLPRMSFLGIIAMSTLLSIPVYGEGTGDSATCQCGVFLLGSGPLTFSPEAKPVLAGLPVTANCSASDDKISCATICRQLIQAMSGNQENTPLVQTVVLAATRTLACQRFNESQKVPAPRNFEGANRQTLAQLDHENKWKFFVGPSSHGARSDLASERVGNSPQNGGIDGSNNNAEQEEESSVALTEPKWLGGYYRWCDEHWIYAGVSLHEPLCCQGHVPKRCRNYQPEETSTSKSARNGRRPRLIVIKRCPNNVCPDEEDDDETDPSSGETSSNKVSTTSVTHTTSDDGEDETEAPETSDKEEEKESSDDDPKEPTDEETSSETINPYTTPKPPVSKPLNATVMSEALKFFETLMEGLGYGEIFEGVRSVLPETTAVQLLERINHGGWLTHYQDRYIKWPREFSLGYCYLEYSMYNVKEDGGLMTAVSNTINRVFAADHPLPSIGARLPQQPQSPQPLPSPLPYETNLSDMNNYISQIPQLPGNSFGGYEQYDHSRIPGNRRVRRGVSVSRSYDAQPGQSTGRSSTGGRSVRRNPIRRVKPQSRTVPLPPVYETNPVPNPAHYQTTAAPTPVATPDSTRSNQSQFVPLQTIQPNYGSGASGASNRQSSFVPTHPENRNNNYERFTSSNAFPKVYRNNVPYAMDAYQQSSPVRRSHQENNSNHANLAEMARPRRHPGGEETIEDNNKRVVVTQSVPTTGTQRGPLGPPPPPLPPPQPQRKQATTPKDGPSAGNMLNLANILLSSALQPGGNNDGDKVTNLMQTALPLVSQVANNPAIHSMVNSIVTSFLTPPNPNAPSSPPPSRPRPEPEDNWGSNNSPSNKRPPSKKNPINDSEELEENSAELDEPVMSSTNEKPVNKPRPPSGGGGGGGASDIIASMVQQMISSYIGHIFQSKPGRPPRPSNNPKPIDDKDKIGTKVPSADSTESNDIVDVIANAAKPFFISTFGVVPGDPGYGRLLNRRRDDFKRYSGTSSQNRHNPNDILTEDPDPGTGIVDIFIGPQHFPETGSKVYDFGNRVVYAFTNANDPHHGVYCFKQYFVNKVWDYFRMGVRAVFK